MKHLKTYEEINWSKLNPKNWGRGEINKVVNKIKNTGLDIKDINNCLCDIKDMSDDFDEVTKGPGCYICLYKLKEELTDDQLEDYLEEVKGRIGDIDPNIYIGIRIKKHSYYIDDMGNIVMDDYHPEDPTTWDNWLQESVVRSFLYLTFIHGGESVYKRYKDLVNHTYHQMLKDFGVYTSLERGTNDTGPR